MSWWKNITSALTIQPKLTEDMLFLKKVSFMRALTDREIALFSKYLHVRHFAQGEFIFKEDYPQVVLYFIKQGEIELLPHQELKEPNVKLAKFQYVGIEELFLNSKRWCSAIAKTDCVLLGISKFDFKAVIKKNPRLGIKILYGICTSFSRYLKHVLIENVQENDDETR
jgi:CRP-like cAMP-binding protein